MPLRQCLQTSSCLLRRDVPSCSRALHITIARRSNHYEALGLEPNASLGDIKKQFYSLSKIHHPDHNPNDPQASERFIKVSEAYATLGSPEKRKRYDRDVLRASTAPQPATRSGSYSSASSYSSSPTFGARPASGLSRRRTQFRGPPPSFYRNGGWGSYGPKRQVEADETAEAHARYAAAANAAAAGGMGPGQAFSNDVPHFDQVGHLRTQEQQEQRRRRMRGESVGYDDGGSSIARFLLISGIVTLACSPFMMFQGSAQPGLARSSKKEKT